MSSYRKHSTDDDSSRSKDYYSRDNSGGSHYQHRRDYSTNSYYGSASTSSGAGGPSSSSSGLPPRDHHQSLDPVDDYTRATFGGNEHDKTFSEDLSDKPLTEQELFRNVATGIDFRKYEDIPVDCTGNIPPITSFETASIHEIILANIKRATYKTPTPVQKYAIPIGLAGKDLMACAQTGSGKTAAFLIPVLTRTLREPPPDRSRSHRAYPTFLILAPTRELAIQIHKEALKFSYTSWLRPVVVYGGAPFSTQAREVERGVDILVGTPGRLIDMLDRGKVSLSRVRYLCFDEADRMLDMGFEKDIRKIVEQRDMPGPKHRTTTMFSATFPREIRQLASDFLHDFLFLTVGRVGSTTESITQVVKEVSDDEKREEVVRDLKITPGRTLVFAETKRDTDTLARYLFSHGFHATGIHGDRNQREREAALASFKSGRIMVLVATDVASRGLDISDIVHVINYDLPASIDSYIHRIGRTGRAGNRGLATSYFNDSNRGIAKDLCNVLKDAHQDVPLFLTKLSSEPYFKDKRNNSRGGAMVQRRHLTRSTPYPIGRGGSAGAGAAGQMRLPFGGGGGSGSSSVSGLSGLRHGNYPTSTGGGYSGSSGSTTAGTSTSGSGSGGGYSVSTSGGGYSASASGGYGGSGGVGGGYGSRPSGSVVDYGGRLGASGSVGGYQAFLGYQNSSTPQW